jgi:GH35 family endo-1,4-beta-xylanase
MLAFDVYRDGAPLAAWPAEAGARAFCIYLADDDGRPRERAFDFEYGRLAAYCAPGAARRLYTRYPVAGFGDPILRTRVLDGSRLYTLAVELAAGRLELLEDALRGGDVPADVRAEIDRAAALTHEAQALEAAGQRAAASDTADAALAISVPAGERLALAQAQARLARRREAGELQGFFFGATSGAYVPDTPRGDAFLQACNYATLPFYLNGVEPEPGVVKHDGLLKQSRLLHAQGVALKGHPLVWTYTPCVPAHRRQMDFDTCCRVFRERILRDVPPFAGLIDYWDIINEAHDLPWANSFAFSSAQMVELTRVAAEATREAAPHAKRVINVCLPFGEYAAGAPGRATTLEYLRACLDAGIDFEIIGIQFYYGSGLLQYCWDMLEVSRMLDAYVALGKEVHITELGTPSAMGPDPNAMIKEGNEVGLWHEAWSEATQADWVEQFYTLCMSKPGITALTQWSFSDAAPVFWPHSGLLDKDDRPKEAFRRVVALREMCEGTGSITD